jgi:hypothetical protein
MLRLLTGTPAQAGSARQSSGSHAAARHLSQLKLVVDSCSLQGALRAKLKHGKSGMLEGIRTGILHLVAPRQLDREIRRHLRDIASDCGVAIAVARALYNEIAAFIEFKSVRAATVRRLRRQIPNPEDAAFVALLFESDALGVVTEEKDYARIPGLAAYTAAETSRMVLCYRKQAVVLVCSVPMLKLAGDVLIGLVGGSCRLVRQYPNVALGVMLALVAFAILYPDKVNGAIDAVRSRSGELWSVFGPFIVAFGTVAWARVDEAAATREHLAATRRATT